MDIQTKDGILLRGIPDGTPDEEIKARIKKVRDESASPSLTPEQIEQQHQRAAASMARAEHPWLAKAADVAGGMSATMRGLFNIGQDGQGLGDRIWPTDAVDKRSGAYLAGQIADPAALAIGGGAVKAAQTAKAIPKLAQFVAGNAAGGAAVSGLQGEDPLVGAAVGAAVPVAMAGGGRVGKLVGDITGPMRESWRTSQGGRYLAEQLGSARQAVRDAIINRGSGPLTTADAVAQANVGQVNKIGSPLVAIEDQLIRQPGGISDAAKSVWAKQEAGRRATLSAAQPDEIAAVAAREAATAPLYQQADVAVVKLDAPFQKLFERMPKGTMEKAADIARMEGRPFQVGEYIPASKQPTGVIGANGKMGTRDIPTQYPEMTGENLHYIKRALSDLANAHDPAAGIGRDTQAAARGVLGDFIGLFEKRVPSYGAAREAYAVGSKPIEQSKVIQAMQDVLSGQGGAERVTPFLNVLGRGEQAMLKRSTGFPRYETGDLPKVLTGPGQMDAVNRVSSELTRDLERKALAQNVDTGHLFNIADKGKGAVILPNLLSRPAMVANFVMRNLGRGADEMITKDMGELMVRDPSGFVAKYLADVPPTRRAAVMELLKQQLGTQIAPIVQQ